MQIQPQLVAGRLDLELIRAERAGPPRHVVNRLGLAPRAEAAEEPVLIAADGPPRKRSFKLPAGLLHRLKAYATVRGKFQYSLVAEALTAYLDRAAACLGYQERSAMVKLQQQYAERQTGHGRPSRRTRRPETETETRTSHHPIREALASFWVMRRFAKRRHRPDGP